MIEILRENVEAIIEKPLVYRYHLVLIAQLMSLLYNEDHQFVDD